jgi:hypothetical protein
VLRTLSLVVVTVAAVAILGLAATTVAFSPFSKVWTVAVSSFNQSNQFANSLALLSNGNIVAAGGDLGNQAGPCKGFLGGMWVIGVNQGGGGVSQKHRARWRGHTGEEPGASRRSGANWYAHR